MKPIIERSIARNGYDRRTCWVHARGGFLGENQSFVVAMQKLLLRGSDIFYEINNIRTDDDGQTWSEPQPQAAFARWQEPGDIELAVSDFTPQWHQKTAKLIGTGHICRYHGEYLMPSPWANPTAYAVFDESRGVWGEKRFLEMPSDERFYVASAGSAQRFDKENGEILLPLSFCSEKVNAVDGPYGVVVARCKFDGERLEVLEVGDEVTCRGVTDVGEPSLTFSRGRYWITLRHQERGYYSTSEDGLHFEEFKPWTFDDGSDLGTYQTQQHWLMLGDRLFLVYTRRGLDNDHIFRHRAPLVLGEVDQGCGCIIRESEQILIPERGARLCNFGVAQRNSTEAWVIASEWMQNSGIWVEAAKTKLEGKMPIEELDRLANESYGCGICDQFGSDNSLHVVKVKLEEVSNG